jgi:hypothetical protein
MLHLQRNEDGARKLPHYIWTLACCQEEVRRRLCSIVLRGGGLYTFVRDGGGQQEGLKNAGPPHSPRTTSNATKHPQRKRDGVEPPKRGKEN